MDEIKNTADTASAEAVTAPDVPDTEFAPPPWRISGFLHRKQHEKRAKINAPKPDGAPHCEPPEVGFSVASFVLGLISVISLNLLAGILGIVFSGVGRKFGGKHYAVAGLATSIVGTVLGACALALAIVIIALWPLG